MVNSGPKIMSTDPPVITTEGLDDIGVTLELAYPGKSWQEVVLKNRGKHHIIAAVVRYEFTKQDGSKGFARDVICDPRISLESNAAKLKDLLVKYPVIPPDSTWLCGVGLDRLRLTGKVPPLEEIQHLVFQPVVLTPPPLKSLHITLDGAIIEDGQLMGPQRDNPKQWVTDIINASKQDSL